MVYVHLCPNAALVLGAARVGHVLLRRYFSWYSLQLLLISTSSITGVKVLFKVGLVLLKYSFTRPKAMKECPTMYESMELLRHLHPSITEENALVSRVGYSVRLTRAKLQSSLYLDAEAADRRVRYGTGP